MIYLTIDLGQYSVKFIESKVEKKKLLHLRTREILLSEVPIEDLAEEPSKGQEVDDQIQLPLWVSQQLHIIKKYLEETGEVSRIHLNLPTALISSRFIPIPVKNLKKALNMVNFQLEDDIPFSLGEAQMAIGHQKTDDGFLMSTSFLHRNSFDIFHKKLQNLGIDPDIVTSTLSCQANWIATSLQSKDESPTDYVVINLGHKNTEVCFYKNHLPVASFLSHRAGALVDEMIIANYEIDRDGAQEFKHEKAFFLIPEQYSDVDADQAEFAKKMETVFLPFFEDFRRWEVTVKLAHGVNAEAIYVCGGTARIKNIDNFLARHLSKPIHFLKDRHGHFESYRMDEQSYLHFAACDQLAISHKLKQNVSNFLTGEYVSTKSEDIPLFSISYVGVRAAILTACLMFGFFIESFFIQKDLKTFNKQATSMLSNPSLGLSQTDRINSRKKPEVVIKKIKSKLKKLNKEVKELEGIGTTFALSFFGKLNTSLGSTGCTLQSYSEVDSGKVDAEFGDCPIVELEKLKKRLSSLADKASGNIQGQKLSMNWKVSRE